MSARCNMISVFRGGLPSKIKCRIVSVSRSIDQTNNPPFRILAGSRLFERLSSYGSFVPGAKSIHARDHRRKGRFVDSGSAMRCVGTYIPKNALANLRTSSGNVNRHRTQYHSGSVERAFSRKRQLYLGSLVSSDSRVASHTPWFDPPILMFLKVSYRLATVSRCSYAITYSFSSKL
jgi:hypothetical protein